MNQQKANFIYSGLIGIVRLVTGFAFNQVYLYFQREDRTLNVNYPTVIFANHIMEEDIIALAHVYPKINPKIKLGFAMRQDIIEPDFLVKEFSPKGILKFFLWLIDKSKIIKILLLYIGGVGIKRPFRDDARKLIKSGELRNLVESQFEKIADKGNEGRNLFLFPEGKFSQDGYLESIRRGIHLLNQKVPNLKCTFANLTYDFLAKPKMDLHIAFGDNYAIHNLDEKKISEFAKVKLGESFVLTSGNFFSYSVFQKVENLNLSELELKLKLILNDINESKKIKFISEKLISKFKTEFDIFFKTILHLKFLELNEGKIFKLEKINKTEFRTVNELRKKNPYFYHKNQLRYFEKDLDSIFIKNLS